jgi:hypothetical protein
VRNGEGYCAGEASDLTLLFIEMEGRRCGRYVDSMMADGSDNDGVIERPTTVW